MRSLIDHGHVFIACPPLYKVKRGKEDLYLANDKELNAYVIARRPRSGPVEAGERTFAGTELHHLLQSLIDYDQYLTAIERMGSTAAASSSSSTVASRTGKTSRTRSSSSGWRSGLAALGHDVSPPERDEEHGLPPAPGALVRRGVAVSSSSISSCGRPSRCASSGSSTRRSPRWPSRR
jgi:hypothetical protein